VLIFERPLPEVEFCPLLGRHINGREESHIWPRLNIFERDTKGSIVSEE
jgi:hypothetical protein